MTENMQKMKGIFALISMPFKDNGDVDFEEFGKLAEYLTTKTGIHGIGLYGMVSEFHKLTDYEKTDLTRLFLETVQKTNVPSLVSITDYSTVIAARKAKEYESIGADSLMLLPPSFLKPSIEEIRYHMISVLEAVKIPVVIQYAPQATGHFIENSELIDMANKYENAAFKIEYKPAIDFLKPFLEMKKDMIILTGYAGLEMLDLYKIGVRGVMPACSFTELYVAIYDAYFADDLAKARMLYDKLEAYLKTWMASPESLLAIEKEILVRRKIIKSSYCRRPAYHLSAKDSRDIDQFLTEFSAILG